MNFYTKQLIVQADAEWYYHDSDTDLGLRSNYLAMVNCALLGPVSGYSDNTSYSQFHASDRKSEIQAILRSLSNQDQKILYSTYGIVKYPTQIELLFNHLSGTAYIISGSDPEKFTSFCSKIHSGKATQNEKTILQNLKTKSQTLFQQAVNNYLISKKLINKEKK